MPTSIVPQDQDGQDVYNAISSFFFKFEVGNLLRKCNAQKEKGVPVLDIFKYKLCNVFSGRSMYMQQKNWLFQRGILQEYLLSVSEQHQNQLAQIYDAFVKESGRYDRASYK